MQPVITPREAGILAGLSGRDEFSSPYHYASYASDFHNRDHIEWQAGHRLGQRLLTLAAEEGS